MLGEFGIGTNDKARITGGVLEDEKVYAKIHVAVGGNHTFGGTIVAGVYIDLAVKEPDVYLIDRFLDCVNVNNFWKISENARIFKFGR